MCTGMKEWREEIIEETTERVEKETAERVERETAERLEVQNTVNYAQNLIDNEGFRRVDHLLHAFARQAKHLDSR